MGTAGNSRRGQGQVEAAKVGLDCQSVQFRQSGRHSVSGCSATAEARNRSVGRMYRYPLISSAAAACSVQSSSSLVAPCGCIASKHSRSLSSFLLRSSCLMLLLLLQQTDAPMRHNTHLSFFPSTTCEHVCYVRRDPASSAAIYLAFLQVGLEVADLFQAVFSHKTDPGTSSRARHAHTATCRPLIDCVHYAVHVDGIAIDESRPLPLAAVHWGKPQQPTPGPKTRRHMAWQHCHGTAWSMADI